MSELPWKCCNCGKEAVGWIRACKEAKACITAALEVRNG